MATFDVIVPAYNAAHYLPKALDSVVTQTFSDWRILLIDDGSRDNTPEIVAPYQEQLGDKLLYIRQENVGLPAARNTAIRHATAEFLALLDADDIWLPNRLQKTYERFQEVPQAGITYGFVARIDPDGEIIDYFKQRNAHAEGHVAAFLYMRMLDLPCPTVTFRRSCVKETGGFDEALRASEDRDLWIRIGTRHEIALVSEVIALYRVSPQSMSADLDRMRTAQLRVIEKHYGLPGCGWSARRIALNGLYRNRAESLADRGQLGPALGDAFRAVRYYPFQAQTLRTAASLLLRNVRALFGMRSRLAS